MVTGSVDYRKHYYLGGGPVTDNPYLTLVGDPGEVCCIVRAWIGQVVNAGFHVDLDPEEACKSPLVIWMRDPLWLELFRELVKDWGVFHWGDQDDCCTEER